MDLREQLMQAEERYRTSSAVAPRSGAKAGWCIFATPAGCCSKKFECRREADLVRVVGAAECHKDCKRAVPTLRIGAVITAWNEGDEVRKTVESLAGSVRDPRTELAIYICDDGSTDGSCENLPSALADGRVRVLRHRH